ncbi:MAG: LAGLIDADG family homing endonuclease, partial [Candidatus Hodarchaeales archaeon]
LYTSGKGISAAGLCVSGDSSIILSDGIMPISQIVEYWIRNGDVKTRASDIEYCLNKSDEKKILHSNNLKLEEGKISKFWRIKSPDHLIAISTRTGREIKLTQQTSILSIDRDNGLVWKPAGLVKAGERIATIRQLHIKSTKRVPSIFNQISNYPKPITLCNVEKETRELIEKIVRKKKTTIRGISKLLGVDESNLYRWRNEGLPGSIPLTHFTSLCKILGEDVEKFLPDNLVVEIKKGQRFNLPKRMNKEWFYILGLIFGDGRVSIDRRKEGYGGVTLGFSNREPALIKRFVSFFTDLGLTVSVSESCIDRPAEARVWSSIIYSIFSYFGLEPSPKSSGISPNNDILFYERKYVFRFLRGLYDSDGWIQIRENGSSAIGYSSTSRELIRFVQNALLILGIISYIREREPTTTTLRTGKVISGKNKRFELTFHNHADFVKYKNNIGFNHPVKRQKLFDYCKKERSSHSNLDSLPNTSTLIKSVIDFYNYTSRELTGRKSAFGLIYSGKRNISRERLKKILQKIIPDWHRHKVSIPDDKRLEIYQTALKYYTQDVLAKKTGLTSQQFYDYFIRVGRNPKIPVVLILKLIDLIKLKTDSSNLTYFELLIEKIQEKHIEIKGNYDLLEKLANSDIFWDEISSIHELSSTDDYVYDLTIPDTHNFVVNGFVVHNTAAVLHDPETKELTLEAGALVLADRGIAMIDEFDKMDANDRAGLHEAMESHTVSIAKAGIVATLNARCSILAAANPKLGRWDQAKDLRYNLNLPPAIISRFDLIFPIIDDPDEKRDEERAIHILTQHQRSALVDEPSVDAEFIRKYIAYVRKNCHPKLTDEAIKRILDYYLELRRQSTELRADGKPKSIAITPRQLEAIIRLSEAHARVALRDEVTYEDAEAAIQLMKDTLRKIATDPETGEIDVDRVTSGHSSKTRNKVRIVNDIIEVLTREGDAAYIKEIIAKAEEKDLKKEDVEEIIYDLVQNGVYFEPRPGMVKKIG